MEALFNGLLGIRFRLDYFGNQFADFLHGIVWFAVLAGLARLASVARSRKLSLPFWAGVAPTIFAGVVLCFVLPIGDWQFNRYFLHFLVLYVPLLALGFIALDERLALRGWLIGFVLFSMCLTIPYWSQVLARSSREVLQHHVRLEQWMTDHLPPGAQVAVNEAGFAAWRGDWKILDLFGLVSKGFESPKPFSIYERLEALPRERRPDYITVYPHWFPQLDEAGFMSGIATVHLPGELDAVGNDMTVYRPDWTLAGSSRLPIEVSVTTMSLVDMLNVGNSADEQAHHYTRSPYFRDDNSIDWTYRFQWHERVAIDAGYYLRGTESFDMKAKPGEPLTLVNRFEYAYHDHSPIYVDVAIDGQPAGTWRFTPWITASRDFAQPADDGWPLKGRGGDFYLDTAELTSTSQLLIELTNCPVREGQTQHIEVRDSNERVLYEDDLTSGQNKSLTVPLAGVPRAGQTGFDRLAILCSYEYIPDLITTPGETPAIPRTITIRRFGLKDTARPQLSTRWRAMRTLKTSRESESAFTIPAALIKSSPVHVTISTNTHWSEDFHNSFHYWAYTTGTQTMAAPASVPIAVSDRATTLSAGSGGGD